MRLDTRYFTDTVEMPLLYMTPVRYLVSVLPEDTQSCKCTIASTQYLANLTCKSLSRS